MYSGEEGMIEGDMVLFIHIGKDFEMVLLALSTIAPLTNKIRWENFEIVNVK